MTARRTSSEGGPTQPNGINGAPVVSVYLDFGNSLLYLGGMSELATGSSSPDDVSNVQTIKLAEQAPFTIKVSTTHVYVLEINGTFTYQGEEERIDGLLIPTNGGSTFFFLHLTSPYSGDLSKDLIRQLILIAAIFQQFSHSKPTCRKKLDLLVRRHISTLSQLLHQNT